MHTPRIKAKDMLQIQTKEISYPSNIALTFELRGETIHVKPNESFHIIEKNDDGDILRATFNSTVRTIPDNTILAHYMEKIGKAIENGALRQACIELFELLPNQFKEIDIDMQEHDLLSLYALYHCFLNIVWQLPITNPIVLYHMKSTVIPLINDQDHLCWAFISYIQTILFDKGLRNQIVVNPPRIYEILHADSLYSALVYQLLMHISGGKQETRGSWSACAACGNSFFHKNKHKRYCENCDLPSIRTRDCRAKKKEAQHAQESNP